MNDVDYRAKWVICNTRSPIQDGVVSIRGGKIFSVKEFSKNDRASSFRSLIDLGDVAIIPGLINAHCHLEFSHLSQPLGHAGIPFTDWIRLVIEERSNRRTSLSESVLRGMQEVVTTGTVAIGEIATRPWPISLEPLAELYGRWFLERLGNQPQLHATILEESQSILSQLDQLPVFKSAAWRLGISPHAPYSVPLELLRGLTRFAEQLRTPLAIHVAETRAEIELLEHQTGPFVELLRSLGAWFPASQNERTGIRNYLEWLKNVPNVLLVHGNYLGEQDLDIVAKQSKTSIVYCPRTHHFFRHDPYPLAGMLRRGINVAVGTDSRASNPDLSLWRELQFIANAFPTLDPQLVLKMGTWNGAIALDLHDLVGDIAPGLCSRLLQVHLDSQTNDPLEQLFHVEESHVDWIGVEK
ncbi:MAG TPA: amidohydrolase family protein [Pirellulaceae bacterium]|mgnify:CR=1 FL=1|nr:amidohydrolase family protein [Pirellulaceae bacterium]HMO91537.1 amidohydrolase family protein [Pirellulaceae bacterium]HMP68234.1 amidohydrolase family protein [Pirellulaceae bacterium]